MSVNRNESNLSRDVRLNKAEIQGHTEDSGAVFNPLVIQKMVCIFQTWNVCADITPELLWFT